MSVHVLRCSAARWPPYSLCLPSHRTGAYYSRSALSSFVSRIQNPRASASAELGGRTAAWGDSHLTVANTKNPLDPTRLDRYLASIKALNLEPTLDDVERCKPEGFPRPDSSRYVTEYTNLLEMLCRSFSKDQLRRFTELYELDPIWTRSSRRKTEYAESIIEKAWGWPSLKEIERRRRDTTEMLIKSFPVTPSQLFLIMGKDGADLLQLSLQYNVHISLASSPLALHVEGLRGSLKGLSEYVSSFKKNVIDEIFELPTGRPIRSDLLQRISRLSGAYVENHGNRGKVRICARDLNDIAVAKRLALRASLEIGTQIHSVCYDPPSKTSDSPIEISEPYRYSVYPFVTPSSFPWTMHSGGTFRLRRVADWLDVNSCEDIASTGGLAYNPHRLLNLNQSGVQLDQLVSPAVHKSTLYHRRIITASLGHMLISSGDSLRRTTMFPPFRGVLSLPDILKWVETTGVPLTFVPSVPPTMTAIHKRRVLHRLIYRTLPQVVDQVLRPSQHVLKFELDLSGSSSISARATQVFEKAPKLRDTSSDQLNSSVGSPSSRQCVSQLSNPSEVLDNPWDSSCQVGEEVCVNIMLPDRQMDVQFCIFDWDDVISMQQPQGLSDYANELRNFEVQASQPDPPSTFSYEGRAYYLHENLSLSQSNNLISLPTILNDNHGDDLVEVCIESTRDLQSTQKMQFCQVKFDGTADGPSWKCFLAACDQLSAAVLEPRSKKDKLQTTQPK